MSSAKDSLYFIKEYNAITFSIFDRMICISNGQKIERLKQSRDRLLLIANNLESVIIDKTGPLLQKYKDDILAHLTTLDLEKKGESRPTKLTYGIDRFFENTEQHELEAIGSKKSNSKKNKEIYEVFETIKDTFFKLPEKEKEYFRIIVIKLYATYHKYQSAVLTEKGIIS